MPRIGVAGDVVDVRPFSTPTTLAETQSFFKVDGKNVLVHGDRVGYHQYALEEHTMKTLQSSQSFFKVNGVNVIIGGNFASCGHASRPNPAYPADPGAPPTLPNDGLRATGSVNVTP